MPDDPSRDPGLGSLIAQPAQPSTEEPSDGLQSSGMYPKGYKTAMPRRCESALAAGSRERASSDLPCGFIDFSDPIWYKTCTEQLENLQQENAPLIASSAAASTAGHGLHRSFLPLPSVASLPPDRRGR